MSAEKHVHKAKHDEVTGTLLDECADCGRDLRDLSVHFTSEEWPVASPGDGGACP